jgi:archaea-specific DNA-binding protein
MAEKKEAKVAKEPKVAKEAKASVAPKAQEGHFVFIGKKGVMAYVLAVMTQYSEGANQVIIKARGKSISRAVDVAEIVRNKSPEIKLDAINISTEEVVTEDGRPLKISAIEIILEK